MPAKKAKPRPPGQATAKKKSTPKPSAKAGSTGGGVALQLGGITPKERLRMEKEEARWRAQDDLRALRAAEEVRRDPKRLKQVESLVEEEMKALKSIKPKKGA